MSEDEILVTGTMIKDYMFCPTIFYHKYILGVWEPETELMEGGRRLSMDIEHKSRRWRTLMGSRRIKPDKAIYSARVSSKRYGLTGVIDVVYWVGGKCIVLEIKESGLKKLVSSHLYQTAVYGLMAEETFETTVSYLEIYYTLSGIYNRVRFTTGIKRYAKTIIRKIWGMLNRTHIPEPKLSRKCWSCWYRKRCHPQIK